MTGVQLRAGMTLDIPSRDEIGEVVRHEYSRAQEAEREKARGIKLLRRSTGVTTPAGTRVSLLDGITPSAGTVWAVRLVGVWLASAGTGQAFITSDSSSTLAAPAQRQVVAEFATSAAYQVATFPAGACMLNVDEGLYLNFTQNINGYILSGWEVPAEMVYKLY